MSLGSLAAHHDHHEFIATVSDIIEEQAAGWPQDDGYALEIVRRDRGSWLRCRVDGASTAIGVRELATTAVGRATMRIFLGSDDVQAKVLRAIATAALRTWVARRPVTAAEAATDGLAMLERTGQGFAWTVGVCREGESVTWRPARPPENLAVIRAAALARAAALVPRCSSYGYVALADHPAAPRSSASLLANPERLVASAREVGVTLGTPFLLADAGLLGVVIGDEAPLRRIAAGLAGGPLVLAWHDTEKIGWAGP